MVRSSFDNVILPVIRTHDYEPIADSNSINAVKFSSARTTKRFPSPVSINNDKIAPLWVHAWDNTPTPTGFAALLIIQHRLRCGVIQFGLCAHFLYSRSKLLHSSPEIQRNGGFLSRSACRLWWLGQQRSKSSSKTTQNHPFFELRRNTLSQCFQKRRIIPG